MKIMKIATIIRLILSVLLIYCVYFETGLFTSLSFFLIMVDVEIKERKQ